MHSQVLSYAQIRSKLLDNEIVKNLGHIPNSQH